MTPEEGRRPPGRLRRLLVALMALAAVGLGLAALSAYRDLRSLQDAEKAGGSALAAARAYAPEMLSYDYRTIDRDLARAGAHATGALAEQYRRLPAAIGPDARLRHKVQQAVVAAAGVESQSPGEVRVLVFVNLVTSRTDPGASRPTQQVVQSRARLVLVTQGDGWRVSALSTLLGDTPAR
ncbi:hypothetical protein GCM10009530_46900 [Microbispora corallina]|uniref:Mce-associated membrane protein n=1 Tax=Microbispora corallina TaxID=83302 RepID=A0ABQ4G5F7_9ACTN|nr:hypothetical protein [Microbispora corallina]GIH42265.1 hypothetical protein Mco01_52650 [Microbispora corallina]